MKVRIRKSNFKAKKRYGFRTRMKTKGGRAIIRRRRRRGRKIWDKFNDR